MKCWYCGKKLGPYEWVLVVTAKGKTMPVCKDDRACKPTGIKGHGPKPRMRRRQKTKALRKEKAKHE